MFFTCVLPAPKRLLLWSHLTQVLLEAGLLLKWLQQAILL